MLANSFATASRVTSYFACTGRILPSSLVERMRSAIDNRSFSGKLKNSLLRQRIARKSAKALIRGVGRAKRIAMRDHDARAERGDDKRIGQRQTRRRPA